MEIIVLPDDGLLPLVAAIDAAERSVDLTIFRLDWGEIEAALGRAVQRGVHVRALVAHTNRDDDLGLRRLEQRLLRRGVLVARTADHLARYHHKLLIIDRRTLYVLGFNLTHADADQNRSFGLVTAKRAVVQEAVALFQADLARRPFYLASLSLVVSPINARQRLASFLSGARRQLLIYDPKLTDKAMLRLLAERRRAGVEIRVIGQMAREIPGIEMRELSALSLHVRAILRDGTQAFLGSQSLRKLELNSRREVGIIVQSEKVLARLLTVFEADWRTGRTAAPLPEKERRGDLLASRDPEAIAALEEVQWRAAGSAAGAPWRVEPVGQERLALAPRSLRDQQGT